MKIQVYEIKKMNPKNENEYQNFCDIIDMPSLKYGYIEVLGDHVMNINKSQFKKLYQWGYSIYDYKNKERINGCFVILGNSKFFVKN